MADPIIVCTDGSALSLEAIAVGLEVLSPTERVVIVTVVEASDPMAVVGTGTAGGVLTPQAADELEREQEQAGAEIVAAAATELGLTDAETRVLRGEPGPTVCQQAAALSAKAIVVGTRGRGGFRRAILGSVSDHIVRNAPCPVLVSNADAAEEAQV